MRYALLVITCLAVVGFFALRSYGPANSEPKALEFKADPRITRSSIDNTSKALP